MDDESLSSEKRTQACSLKTLITLLPRAPTTKSAICSVMKELAPVNIAMLKISCDVEQYMFALGTG